MSQSPIDLRTSFADSTRLNIEVDHRQEDDLDIEFNGETIKISYAGVGGNTLMLDQTEYNLLQFHFHTPSEHTLNGDHYDMEIHFVHGRVGDESRLAVVGVLVDASDDDNDCAFLEQFLGNLPDQEGEDEEIDIDHLLSFNDDTDFYTYTGSLTTPPCTEGVSWVVKAEPIRCAESQVQAFRNIMGTSNRPVQPRNSRLVSFGNGNRSSSSDSSDDDDNSSYSSFSFDDDDSSSSSAGTLIAGAILGLPVFLF